MVFGNKGTEAPPGIIASRLSQPPTACVRINRINKVVCKIATSKNRLEFIQICRQMKDCDVEESITPTSDTTSVPFNKLAERDGPDIHQGRTKSEKIHLFLDSDGVVHIAGNAEKLARSVGIKLSYLCENK